MPKVSICIPVFNREKILPRAIESCLLQTYKDIEIVICDNASTDNTKKVALKYLKQDNRVKFFENEENIGGLKNFKRTIEHAKGEFCILLGSDDWLSNDFIEGRLKGFELYPNVAFVSGAMATNTLFENGEIKREYEYKYSSNHLDKKYVYDNFYRKYIASYFCMFRTKDILDVYQFDYPNPYGWEIYSKGYGLDLIHCLKILAKYEGIYYTDKGIYNFANHLSRESEDILPESMKENNKIFRAIDDFTYQTFLFNDYFLKNGLISSSIKYKRYKLLQLFYEIIRVKFNISPKKSFFKKFNTFKSNLEITQKDMLYAFTFIPFYFSYRMFAYILRNIFKKEMI